MNKAISLVSFHFYFRFFFLHFDFSTFTLKSIFIVLLSTVVCVFSDCVVGSPPFFSPVIICRYLWMKSKCYNVKYIHAWYFQNEKKKIENHSRLTHTISRVYVVSMSRYDMNASMKLTWERKSHIHPYEHKLFHSLSLSDWIHWHNRCNAYFDNW